MIVQIEVDDFKFMQLCKKEQYRDACLFVMESLVVADINRDIALDIWDEVTKDVKPSL